jgi:hypothetical protein
MFWFNKKHYPATALSIVSMLETDDTIGMGHQIAWRIYKDIDVNATEIKFAL